VIHIEDRDRVPVGHERRDIIGAIVLLVPPQVWPGIPVEIIQVLAARARCDIHDAVGFCRRLAVECPVDVELAEEPLVSLGANRIGRVRW